MSSLKPQLDAAEVLAFVRRHYPSAANLTPIDSGQVSRAYAFSADGVDFVVRFNPPALAHVFRKEAYISDSWNRPGIPIPEIFHIGEYGDLTYAISKRAPGVTLDKLPDAQYLLLLRELAGALHAISTVDLTWTSGYGEFDEHGVGMAASWHYYLRAAIDEEPESGYFGRWHSLFDATFLERDVYYSIYERMLGLLPYCPEDRYLVHGDFGADNALATDHITAIIDWANAKFGDYVYDVAWLDFWSLRGDFAESWQQFCVARDIDVPNYRQRLQCYKCYTVLNALRFFAKAGNEPYYVWTRDRLLASFVRE